MRKVYITENNQTIRKQLNRICGLFPRSTDISLFTNIYRLRRVKEEERETAPNPVKQRNVSP